jgi:hypothetical protein
LEDDDGASLSLSILSAIFHILLLNFVLLFPFWVAACRAENGEEGRSGVIISKRRDCEVGFSLCYLLLDIAGNTAALISPVLCEIHSKYVVVKNNVVSPHRKTLI